MVGSQETHSRKAKEGATVDINLETLPIGEDAPELVNVVVEVPVGSRNKYEYEPELGMIVRDRVLPGNVRYPADYGFVPSTVSADGEPLDAIVFAYDPVFPGCLVRARVIGALEVFENGNAEYNIFAVPDDDPRFADIEVLEDLPQQNLRDVQQFFVTFRQLEGDEEAEVREWHDAKKAYEIIREHTQ
jgi:inorganic pyrophosphatase